MSALLKTQRLPKIYIKLLLLCLFLGSYSVLNAQGIRAIEHFFGQDPGFGNGTVIAANSNSGTLTQNINVSVNGLPLGFHTLTVRAVDNNDVYSLYDKKGFYVFNATGTNNINTMEYWFNTDPGIGNGTAIAVNGGFSPEFTQNAAIPLGSLPRGFNTLNVRARNANGTWGLYDQTSFFVLENPGTANTVANLAALEYWFDEDPGFDNGTAIAVSGNPATLTQNSVIPISGLSQGFHTINVRAKNTNNTWSLYDQTSFFVLENPGTANNVSNLAALEYWFDEDPGFGNGTSMSFSGNPSEVTAQDRVIPLTGLTPGFHKLGIRAQNTDGTWSLLEKRQFYMFKADANTISPIVEELEFSAGEELVFGTGQTVAITATGNPDEFVAEIPESMLKCGTQNIWVSLKNADGNYALYSILVDIEAQNTNLPPEIIVFDNIEVQLDENGQGSLSITDVDNGTNDCDLDEVLLIPANPTYSCSNLGANVVTIRATDETGLESLEAVTITVVDAIAPTVVTQDITVALDAATGSATITPADINNGSTDNCAVDTMSLDVTTFTVQGTYPVILTVTDASNNTATASALVTVTEDSVLSIEDFNAENFNVFPNPTTGVVNINFNQKEEYSLSVYDLLGKKIVEKQLLEVTNVLDLSTYAAGVYILKIRQKITNKYKHIKIIKN